MDEKSFFYNRLSKVIFLDIKKEILHNTFKDYYDEEILLPIISSNLVDKIQNGENLSNIPFSFFIEGIFYVLGADKAFKYNEIYKKLIKANIDNIKVIKSIIFNLIKKENYEDAFILLFGLIQVEENSENYDNLIQVLDKLKGSGDFFTVISLDIIKKAEGMFDSKIPFLYEAIIRNDEENFERSYLCINNYFEKGGQKTPDLIEFSNNLMLLNKYNEGKEIIHSNPTESLKLLLPLFDEYEENAEFLYYIAVAYRHLKNHEKAIYYLNEALAIDTNIVELFNELGINYAALNDYDNAIKYLRKAFEVVKSVEICTNLIMCYYNKGDLVQAKLHLTIAKKLNPEDEIVIKLEKLII
jgi:tetratricopeptide (TPR) repeat protein